MLLTRNKIDRLTALWNAEAIDLKTALEENNIIIEINQDDLKYLIIKLCELRLDLDDSISDNIDIELQPMRAAFYLSVSFSCFLTSFS